MSIKLLGISALLAACFFSTLYATSANTNAAVSPGCSVDPSIDSEEQEFLRLINQYRQQNSQGLLKLSTTLNRSAAWKSQDMATNDYVAHDDTPSGRTWVQRLRDCGYSYNAWLGENIAVGNSSASATFEQWRGSPPHNANMLGSNYTAIGIGRAYSASSQYHWYWTTDFGSYSDGYTELTPSPTPTPTSPPTPQPTSPPPASLPCADVTHDGYVGIPDILYVIARYMTSDSTADLDRSGRVTVTDIVRVVSEYGSNC
jgi:uncharacterized protein YkwD